MLRNGYILHAGISNQKEVGERESTHLELRAPSFPSGSQAQEENIVQQGTKREEEGIKARKRERNIPISNILK